MIGMIAQNGIEIEEIFHGKEAVTEVYLGSELLYQLPLGENLFDPNSSYLFNKSIRADTWAFPYAGNANNRTYFFLCKPNTRYHILIWGKHDRLTVCGYTAAKTPEELAALASSSYKPTHKILNDNTSDAVRHCEFTTDSDIAMVAVCYAGKVIPRKIFIGEYV